MDETTLNVEAAAHHETPHAYNVRLVGELDMDSATVLTRTLDDLLDRGATLVVLDAAGVEFMDSTGLRAIVGAGNRLSQAGGQLLIEGISGAAQRVLEVTGLLDQYKAKPAGGSSGE